MGKKYSVCIAVESYLDPEFPMVNFAENDARGFHSALEAHGFLPEQASLLLSASATQAGIESALRTRCKQLKRNDTVVLFYSGHVFHSQGKTYLTCRDTRPGDLQGSGIGLASLLETLRTTGCQNMFCFFDPCHGAWPEEGGRHGIASGIAEKEMEAYVSRGNPGVHVGMQPIFVACGGNEKSYSSAKLKHGIWSHHLIEAFSGSDKSALEKGRYLTARSLQAYLNISVPKSVRTLLTGIAMQSPRVWGDLTGDIVLLDFKRIFEERAEAEADELKSLEHAFFRGVNSDSVKRLSGWKTGFRVPDTASLSSTSFIQTLGMEDLKARFDSFYDRIRKSFNYKRSQVTSEESPGSFSCITPDFTFSISLGLDRNAPSRYEESVVISEIRNPSIVASPGFGAVFNSEFDEVVLEYSTPFDIGRIIDAIEGMENPKVGVEYPPDGKECTVVFTSMNIRLRFSGKTLVYAFASKALVQKIMEAIKNAPRILGLDGMHA